MDKISVNKLAKLAGVSVRTLHHYDQIGLLKPSVRSETNYRYYSEAELLRLQQILFYKELDLSLVQIAEILDDPTFDIMQALRSHKTELQKRKDRTEQLLLTIDKTIINLKSKTKKMDHEEMYKGFSKEQGKAYRKEASEKWGEEIVAASEKKILEMDKAEWKALLQKGEDINVELVKLIGQSPKDKKVQALIKEHFEMTGKFFNVTIEIYRNLGTMYVEDLRFKANYDKHHPKLAEFLRDGIYAFVEEKK
ncbi:MAG: MerR family transcriptional regulator [Bacteroidetes bacterium]|nr:MerR family transcriptional regulator [Bacteroidota bacterium]